jgi:ubiquinone/menaquinone biosynthesis C-methylase UbiE/uncharacterized protein YbaR (Trm112 family)
MKPALLRYLRCPDCKSTLQPNIFDVIPVTLSENEREIIKDRELVPSEYETEIMTGALQCTRCQAFFPVWQGVPRMYKDAEKDFPIQHAPLSTQNLPAHKAVKQVQISFSREWDEFDYDDGTIWHWDLEDRIMSFAEEIGVDSPERLRGKLMVDAGCGTGILSMTISQKYGIEIIAFDMAHIISRAFLRNKSNLCHFIQSSVLAPPLADAITDLTHSHGVLHHTYNTKLAFEAIARLTKKGGTLYVWLYGKKKGWNRIKYVMTDAFRLPISRLPKTLQAGMVYLMAGMHVAIRSMKKWLGMSVADIKTLNQLLVVTRDRYTPRYAREHTEQEVRGWFEDNGYVSVARRTTWAHTKMFQNSTDLAIKGIRA